VHFHRTILASSYSWINFTKCFPISWQRNTYHHTSYFPTSSILTTYTLNLSQISRIISKPHNVVRLFSTYTGCPLIVSLRPAEVTGYASGCWFSKLQSCHARGHGKTDKSQYSFFFSTLLFSTFLFLYCSLRYHILYKHVRRLISKRFICEGLVSLPGLAQAFWFAYTFS
jgi:hypothetical protein